MTPRLTPEDKQYILRRYQEGASLRGIGREAGRPDITVRRTLEAAGIDFGPPRTTNKRSDPETEALVLRRYDEGRTWKQVMAEAGVTDVTLGRILKRNGRKYDRRTDAEANAPAILALYDADYSTREISRMLGHGKSTVNAVIVRHSGQVRQMTGCDLPGFFGSVDTAEKAYWLGFLSADGCVVATPAHPEGDRLNVKLAARDIGHLVKLKAALTATANVCTGMQGGFGKPLPYASLTVCSRELVDSLLALGIGPRKSATVEPWDGPADLMPHCWRGLFDGDGSLAYKMEGVYTAFLCGSEPCVRGFLAWAHGVCGTKATPYFRTGCWYVSISGRYQVPVLVRAMYENAPVSLDRKQEIADAVLAADGPRKKPGPASRFASEDEKREHMRKAAAERQRRYKARKRREAAEAK